MSVWATDFWAADFWAVDFWSNIESSYTESGDYGGVSRSAEGVMGTVFLTDAEAVPAGAYPIGGFMHDSDGKRYVALWPSSGEVYYVQGIACREDGAMCIAPNGTPEHFLRGMAVTDRGEVITSTLAPQTVKGGQGFRNEGYMCVSESS